MCIRDRALSCALKPSFCATEACVYAHARERVWACMHARVAHLRARARAMVCAFCERMRVRTHVPRRDLFTDALT
eukprot:6179509-Pleurochrysis_carterae.AAC.1